MFHMQGIRVRSRSLSPTERKGSSKQEDPFDHQRGGKLSKISEWTASNAASRDDDESTTNTTETVTASTTRGKEKGANSVNNSNGDCIKTSQKNATLVLSLRKEHLELHHQIRTMSGMIENEKRESEWIQKNEAVTLEKLIGYSTALRSHNQDLSETCDTLEDKIMILLRQENEDFDA